MSRLGLKIGKLALATTFTSPKQGQNLFVVRTIECSMFESMEKPSFARISGKNKCGHPYCCILGHRIEQLSHAFWPGFTNRYMCYTSNIAHRSEIPLRSTMAHQLTHGCLMNVTCHCHCALPLPYQWSGAADSAIRSMFPFCSICSGSGCCSRLASVSHNH